MANIFILETTMCYSPGLFHPVTQNPLLVKTFVRYEFQHTIALLIAFYFQENKRNVLRKIHLLTKKVSFSLSLFFTRGYETWETMIAEINK